MRNTSRGLELDVYVQPGARRSAIVGTHADRLKVAVHAPPVDGKANDALTRFLAETFGVPRSKVEIARGGKSREKTVLIDGLTVAKAEEVIEQEIGTLQT